MENNMVFIKNDNLIKIIKIFVVIIYYYLYIFI